MTRPDPEHSQQDLAAVAAHGQAPTPDRLLDSAFAFWRSALLLSAYELGLFADLAQGPRDAATLVKRLGLRVEETADFLNALVALGLVEQSAGQYRNTVEASLFLDPARPSYLGHQLAMASAARREMPDLTTQLRAGNLSENKHSPLTGRMWADIAGVLEAAGTSDTA